MLEQAADGDAPVGHLGGDAARRPSNAAAIGPNSGRASRSKSTTSGRRMRSSCSRTPGRSSDVVGRDRCRRRRCCASCRSRDSSTAPGRGRPGSPSRPPGKPSAWSRRRREKLFGWTRKSKVGLTRNRSPSSACVEARRAVEQRVAKAELHEDQDDGEGDAGDRDQQAQLLARQLQPGERNARIIGGADGRGADRRRHVGRSSPSPRRHGVIGRRPRDW